MRWFLVLLNGRGEEIDAAGYRPKPLRPERRNGGRELWLYATAPATVWTYERGWPAIHGLGVWQSDRGIIYRRLRQDVGFPVFPVPGYTLTLQYDDRPVLKITYEGTLTHPHVSS